MKLLPTRASALVLAMALLFGSGCRSRAGVDATAGESCGLTDDGGVFDVTGRPDGVYGVRDDRLGPGPLATFNRIVRTGEGVDPANGKRWIGMHLASEEARAIGDFTKDATNKKIAVVAGGQLASVHKVREAITSANLQISCCDPRACDRWNTLLTRPR